MKITEENMQAAVSTAERCTATNKNGKPCAGYARPDSLCCWAHDPALAARRQAGRSAGGRARHGRKLAATTFSDDRGPVRICTVTDILSLLERAAHDLMTLENSISRARALTGVAVAALKALEVGEIENRIAVLEGAVSYEQSKAAR